MLSHVQNLVDKQYFNGRFIGIFMGRFMGSFMDIFMTRPVKIASRILSLST